MHSHRSLLLAAILALSAGPVLAQGSSEVQERRQEIDSSAQATLDELMNAEASVRDLYGRAVGYAVFTVTKGGFIVSGGGGNGVAVNKTTGQRTYMRMGMAGIGLGIGGQRYNLVMLFETEDRLAKFIAGGWDSSATAEAAAGQEGVAVRSSFIDGVAFFQITDKGLMGWADVTGTKFWVNDELR
jgi:lipid-binding SYLF domain-containing protein